MKPRDEATPGRIMTVAEVAEYFNIGRNTICKLARKGKIPAFKIDQIRTSMANSRGGSSVDDDGVKTSRRNGGAPDALDTPGQPRRAKS